MRFVWWALNSSAEPGTLRDRIELAIASFQYSRSHGLEIGESLSGALDLFKSRRRRRDGPRLGQDDVQLSLRASKDKPPNVEFSGGPAGQSNNLGGRGPSAGTQG